MADLNVTITEEVSVNEKDYGNTNNVTITGVSEVNQRVVSVGLSEQTLVLFAASAAAGTIPDGDAKYVRMTNMDDTNFITLRVLGTSEEYFIRLDAGKSVMWGNDQMDANATGSQAVSLANMESIKGAADTAICKLELFIAY